MTLYDKKREVPESLRRYAEERRASEKRKQQNKEDEASVSSSIWKENESAISSSQRREAPAALRKYAEERRASEQRKTSNAIGNIGNRVEDHETGVRNWMSSLDSFSKRMSDEYAKRDGVYQDATTLGKYKDATQSEALRMQDQAKLYRTYFEDNRSKYDDDTVNEILKALEEGTTYLGSVYDSVGSEYDYWSQFKDENEYNEYTRLSALDLKAAQKELDELNRQREQAKAERDAAYNQLMRADRYGAPDRLLARSGGFEEKDAVYQELNEKIAKLNRDIYNAQHYQDSAKYNAYMQAEDFGQYTGTVTPKDSKYMTEDEQRIYNYVLSKEGEDAAQQYMDHLEEAINYRKGTEEGEEIRGIESDIGRFLAATGNEAQTGFVNFGRGIKQLFTDEMLATSPTQYADAYLDENYWKNVGSEVPYTGRTTGQIWSEAVSTITNMAPSILVSYAAAKLGAPQAAASLLAAGTLGASAGGNAYTQALQDGYTKDQARNYGVAVGASEGALQYLLGGISKLSGTGNLTNKMLAKVSSIDNGLLRAAAAAGVKGAGEVVEEELQNYLEPLYRKILFNEEYTAPEIEDIVYTAVLTFLTTGVLEGGDIVSYASNAPKTYGKQIKGADALQGLIESGLESAPDTESRALAEALNEKVQAGKTVNDWEVGRLQQANEAAIRAEAAETAPETLEDVAREVVARENSEAQAASQQAKSVPYNVMSVDNPARQAVMAQKQRSEDYANALGYGEHGRAALQSISEQAEMSTERANTEFHLPYLRGLSNMEMSEAGITSDTQLKAFNAGRMDRIQSMNLDADKAAFATVHGKESGLVQSAASKKYDKKAVAVLNKASKAFGTKTMLVDEIWQKDGKIVPKGTEGAAEADAAMQSNGVMLVSMNAGDPLYTLTKHEFTHRFQQLAPAEYQQYRDAVMQYVVAGDAVAATSTVERYQNRLGLNVNRSADEIAADFSAYLLKDVKEASRFFDSLLDPAKNTAEQVKKNRTMLERFMDAARAFVQKIKQAFGGDKSKMDAAAQEAFGGTVEQLQELEKLWKQAAEASAKAVQKKVESGTKQEYTGANKNDAMFSRKGYWRSDLTKAQMKDLIRWVKYDIKTSENSICDTANWTFRKFEGLPVFAIYSTQNESDPTILYEVKGAQAEFEKNVLKHMMEEFKNGEGIDGKSVVVDAVLSRSWVRKAGSAGNGNGALERGRGSGNAGVLREQSGRRPSAAFESVLRNLLKDQKSEVTGGDALFSMKKDSNGNSLTKEQQEYFKDSKVRDENGNLRVLYHGTGEEFTVFDKARVGQNFEDQGGDLGFYFTPNKADARGYASNSGGSHVESVYLNLTNPLIVEDEGWGSAIRQADVRHNDLMRWAKAGRHDGIIVISTDFEMEDGSPDAVYIAFEPEQIKRTDNVKPTDDPDIRFSMKTPVEETKDLIALHNMTEKNLRGVLRLGGFPMPSLAIVKADAGHTKYGAISVVFGKDTIDPQVSSKNKVYGGDAYTPTDPGVYYPMDRDVERNFDSMVWDASQKFAGGEFKLSSPLGSLGYNGETRDDADEIADRLSRIEAVQAAYLAEQGKSLEPVMSEKVSDVDPYGNDALQAFIDRIGQDALIDKFYDHTEDNGTVTYPVELSESEVQAVREVLKEKWRNTPRFGKPFTEDVLEKRAQRIDDWRAAKFAMNAWNFYVGGGYNAEEVDHEATRNAMWSMISPDGKREAVESVVREWAKSKLDGLLGEPGVYNGKSAFTPSGNRRSFSQRHDPYTLENIVKAMKTNQQERGGQTFGISAGSLQATAAPSYKSVAEIKADSGRLGAVDSETYRAKEDAVNKQIDDIIARIHSNAEEGYGGYYRDVIGGILKEAAEGKKTVDAIVRKFKAEGYNISTQTAKEIQALYKAAAELPTEYFEAKPQRAVGFDEVLAVVVPDDLDAKLVDEMTGRGVNVLTFKAGDDADRLRVINTVDDARFSVKGQGDLLAENAKLREVNAELQEQFKTTKFAKVDKKSLDSFAKKLLKDYQSGADINETRDALDALYTYIANGENGEAPVWQEAYKRAYDTAVEILEQSSELDDQLYQEYKALRDEMRTRGIHLAKEYTHDLAGWESINEFRKAHLGSIKMTNDGTPVDVVYQDLAYRYPEFFNEDEYNNPADQLLHIAEVLDSLKPAEVNRYAYNMRESATWMANDIMERFYELPQAKPTFADKAQQKLTKQVIHDAKKLERLRAEKNERIAQVIKREKERTGEVRKKEREKRSKAVKQVKEYYLGKQAAGSERRNSAVLRKRIAQHASDLSKKLLRPTDAQHIPENLRTTVAAVLEAINLESQFTIDPVTGKRSKGGGGDPVKRTEAFRKLKEVYSKILQQEGADMVIDPSLLGNAEEGFDGYFDAVLGMSDTKLADMSLNQLEIVWRVIRAVERSITTAGKMLASKKFESTVEWADAFEEDTDTKRRLKGSKVEALRLDLENPYTFFAHYGKAGEAVFRMLRDAQDAQQRMVEAVNEEVRKIVDPKQVKQWEKEVHEFKTARGEKLVLTVAHMMEIHELMKREQARDHLTKGGIVQPEIKSKKIRRGTDAVLLSLEDIMQIVGKLTQEQMNVADKLQGLMTGILADYGNEASMRAYGYEKFTGTDYFPIKSAKEGVHSNIEKGGNNSRSIKNIGLAKSVIPHASNALDIGGIFSTFASHAADMADYAAWLCPMEDANRLYNFQFRDEMGQRSGFTMKGLLDRYGGNGAQRYWHRLMEDIQNGISVAEDTESIKYINKAIGNVRAASVGANIRVIVQQPTAFLRAAMVLNPADMVKGMAAAATKGGGWKKALKYSEIAKRKDMGGFDISSPAQMNEILFDSKSNLQKFNDVMMWGAGKADAVTWGKIWNACEWAVKGEGKLETGSDEFYERAAELFAEVIDQSQVVDGVLQRSQMMRSSNALAKQATAFMGEPTMALNMMLRAYDGLRNEQDTKRRGAAFKRFGRAAAVLLTTNVVNAFAQSLVDAWRDDDDDEYWEKVMAAFTGLSGEEESPWEKATAVVLSGNVGTSLLPASFIPFVKDLLSILQGYNVTRADADIMADIVSAWQTFAGSTWGEGKKTVANATWNLAKQVGKVFGISASNMTRDIYGLLRTIAHDTGNIAAEYELEKWIYKVSNTGNASRFMDTLYRAYSDDKVVFEKIYDEMLENDYYKSVKDSGEVTTTAEYIADKLKPDLMDDLFALYKNDHDAYEKMYADLISRDFLKKGVKTGDPDTDTFVSTEETISKAMEARMKKDQGVKSVDDLEQRYFTPSQQPKWDSTMSEISSNGLWRMASSEERERLEEKLYGLVTENASGKEMQEKISGGAKYDLDETEYLLYQLALDMYDQPSDKGEYGSYNSQEKADALLAAGLGDSEIAYLWNTDESYEAYDAGVDMENYVRFKAGVSGLESGVDYKKGDTDSRKAAINALMRELGITGSDRDWLYHTEYKK